MVQSLNIKNILHLLYLWALDIVSVEKNDTIPEKVCKSRSFQLSTLWVFVKCPTLNMVQVSSPESLISYLCKFSILKSLLASLPFSFTLVDIVVILKLAFPASFTSVYPYENTKIQSECEDIKELILMGKSQCPRGMNSIPFSVSLSSG